MTAIGGANRRRWQLLRGGMGLALSELALLLAACAGSPLTDYSKTPSTVFTDQTGELRFRGHSPPLPRASG